MQGVLALVYYPVMLNLENKNCVVVGGGKVATRKIASLMQAKANITVVSPEFTKEILQWNEANLLSIKKKPFDTDDVKDAFLVVAATNSSQINLQVFDALNPNQLINIVDHPELCNFIVPTTIHRGKLTIAISTSGSSPLLAKKIKLDLEEILDDSYEQYLNFLDEARKEIKMKIIDIRRRRELFEHLLDPIYLEYIRAGNIAKCKTHLREVIRKVEGRLE